MRIIGDERGFLSIFSKKKKPSLMPQIVPMDYGNLYHTPSLRSFAEDRISGKTAGFGDEYTSRASNPIVQQREARFNEVEMPQLSSELSKRGLARSAGPNLASDVITRAGQQKERDINETVAQFYHLNQLQAKKDISEGVQVAQQNQGQQERMQLQQALQSERVQDKTAAQQRAYEDMDRGNLDKVGAMLLSAGAGFVGSPMPGPLSSSGFNVQDAFKRALGGAAGVQSNILGANDDSALLMELLRRGAI